MEAVETESGNHAALLERAGPAVDGPSPNVPISATALGNEELERQELEAKIKSALAMTSKTAEWTVGCTSPSAGKPFTCTYFSPAQMLKEDAAGRGPHALQSEWSIDPNTGAIREGPEREVETSG